MVDLTSEPARVAPIWRALIELAHLTTEGWTLIGAQMVRLHALRAGRPPRTQSLDADLAVAVPRVYRSADVFVDHLTALGYELAGISAEGIGHRFRREDVTLDVLVTGPLRPASRSRALRTVFGARTLEVPGAIQALARTELVRVRDSEGEGAIPCPDLLGAILVKVRAIGVDDVPNEQRRDVAFLCDLATDPADLAARIKPSERRWLRLRAELLDPGAAWWRGRSDGYIVYSLLAGR